MIIVLDASVVLKWFVEEPDSPAALDYKERYLLGELDVFFPDLLIYEVANVLRFKHTFTEAAVKNSLKALLEMGFDITTPTEPYLEEALHISYKTGLSVYDSCYVTAARGLECPLITADKKLCRLAKNLCEITLIG